MLTLVKDPRFIMSVGFAFGGLFVFLTIRDIDWSEVQAQFAAISPVALFTALALTLLSAFLRSLRWRLLWVNERIAVTRLFTVEMASLGLNNVSPVRLLDEPAILTMLTVRDKLPAPTVVATLMMSRVQDLSFTLAAAAGALALEPSIAERAGAALYVSGIFMVFIVVLLNLGRLARRFDVLAKVPGILSYGQAVSEVARHKPRLAATTSLTIIYWLALGPAAWILANGMGIEITLFQATIVALGAIFLATSLPGLPGAFGTFELAAQELLTIWGVPRELGFGFGLVLHLTFFVPPIAAAVAVLPREGIGITHAWQRATGRSGNRAKRGRRAE